MRKLSLVCSFILSFVVIAKSQNCNYNFVGESQVCKHDTRSYTMNGNSLPSYTWKISIGNRPFLNQPGYDNKPLVINYGSIALNSDEDWITIAAFVAGCEDTLDLVVNIKKNPSKPEIVSNKNAPVCEGDIVNYYFTNANFSFVNEYVWKYQQDEIIKEVKDVESISINYTNVQEGTTNISLQITNIDGCFITSDNYTEEIVQKDVKIIGDSVVCKNEEVTYYLNNDLGDFNWIYEKSGEVINNNADSISINFSEVNDTSIILNSSNTTCPNYPELEPFEIKVKDCVISSTIDNKKSIKIYPNPTQSNIYCDLNNIRSLKLYSIQGNLLLESTKNNIDIHYLHDGIYILEIQTLNDIFYERIKKQ